MDEITMVPVFNKEDKLFLIELIKQYPDKNDPEFHRIIKAILKLYIDPIIKIEKEKDK